MMVSGIPLVLDPGEGCRILAFMSSLKPPIERAAPTALLSCKQEGVY